MSEPPVQIHHHITQKPDPGPKNGLGTSAFVLGIIGTALFWVPILGFFTVVSSLVGVGLGIGGVARAHQKTANNHIIAGIGLALSAFGTVAPWVFWFGFAAIGAAGSNA